MQIGEAVVDCLGGEHLFNKARRAESNYFFMFSIASDSLVVSVNQSSLGSSPQGFLLFSDHWKPEKLIT